MKDSVYNGLWFHAQFLGAQNKIAIWPDWMISYIWDFPESTSPLNGHEFSDCIEYNGFLTEV